MFALNSSSLRLLQSALGATTNIAIPSPKSAAFALTKSPAPANPAPSQPALRIHWLSAKK